jgi:hypothetical protein
MSVQPTIKEQVKSGFLITGGWLLGIAWLGLVYWGIIEAFGTEANFNEGHHPSQLLGYLLLGTSAVIFLLTANRWKRVLPAIMLIATLNSLLELGHGYNIGIPGLRIPRGIALIQLVVIAGVAVLSFTFKTRHLNLLDRMAWLAFATSIYLGGDEAMRQRVPFALVIGGACVFVAWMVDRVRANRSSNIVARRAL